LGREIARENDTDEREGVYVLCDKISVPITFITQAINACVITSTNLYSLGTHRKNKYIF
jgi:hypothetical protein